jgi:hypothetical protein
MAIKLACPGCGKKFSTILVMKGRPTPAPGAIELTFRGGSEFTDAGADELDAMLRSLGPHALEPAVFTGEYDGELRVIPIDAGDWSHAILGGIPILGTVR